MKAVWKDIVLAESDKIVEVEGNIYFPPESLSKKYFHESSHKTTCPWKGEASYYTIEVDGEKNEDAAWYYPNPSEAVEHIKYSVAFWKGVTVEK